MMGVNLGVQNSDSELLGEQMHQLVRDLFPFCRSITGNGVRQTLRGLQAHIPLEVREVPTGTPVFDWIVPKEWNIHDACVKDERGERVIDFRQCNLHVVNYSIPVRARMSLVELKKHLFTIPEHPDWVPYRTSYYKESWGFCLSHRCLAELHEGSYEVLIDSSLAPGSLTYGEYYLPGGQPDEILISCHVCHPSLANDNLSGIAVAAYLAKEIKSWSRRYSFRFLFLPVTIGSITWLALNEERTARIRHGLVLTCLGDSGACTYKRSRRHHAEIDRAAAYVLKQSGSEHRVTDFVPYGYDERQYCSPGINLPVGCFMRTPNGCYPEYHTSADNLDFVKPSALADSLTKVRSILGVLEHNRRYVNRNPKCEPQLGKRGLYQTLGGSADKAAREMAMLWLLNYSDGEHTLLDIAEKSGLAFALVQSAAEALDTAGLLAPTE